MDGETVTPACVLYARPGTACDVCDSRYRPADELLTAATIMTPSVLLVDATLAERIRDPRSVPEHAIIVATDEQAATALGKRAALSLAGMTEVAARRALFAA